MQPAGSGKSCFIEDRLPCRIITRHAKQRAVLVARASLSDKIIKDTHGDVKTGHESVTKTKETFLASYWWPDEFPHEPFCVLDTICAIRTKNTNPLNKTKDAMNLIRTSTLVADNGAY